MANKTMSATAVRKKGKGKISGMRLKAVSNGMKSIAEHEVETPFGTSTQDGDETIHPSMGHALKHVKASFAPHMAATTGMGAAMAGASPATQPTSTPDGGGDDEDE
jgi:hypothetical protein